MNRLDVHPCRNKNWDMGVFPYLYKQEHGNSHYISGMQNMPIIMCTSVSMVTDNVSSVCIQ